MNAHKTQPPWEFLLSASAFSLQSYELSRLNHAANLRKEIAALLDQWLEENASALFARWLIEQRERTAHPAIHSAQAVENPHRAGAARQSASDNVLVLNGVPCEPS